jgi:ABC-type Fe3+/spermidine/putrescine transport system ATPase subunit
MVINKGTIEQVGRTDEIYLNPENVFTARFLGEINVLDGKVVGEEDGYFRTQTPQGSFLGRGHGRLEANSKVFYCVRPEKLRVGSAGPQENSVTANVAGAIYRGTEAEVILKFNDGTRMTYIAYDVAPGAFKEQEALSVHWKPQDSVVLSQVSKVKGIDVDELIYGS